MRIETERLAIRDFNASDANDLYEILGDAETMQNCEPAYDFERTRKFLEEFCIAKKGAFAAALKDSGKVIGYILFNSWGDGVYEIGWIFNKKYWRQGYAYEACCELMTYGFREMNVRKVVAEAIDAEKSVPLMEKLGMKCEGIQRSREKDCLGNRADLYLYGILKSDVSQKNRL